MRQTVGEDLVYDVYGNRLFNDILWSMFMIFRIFMGDTALKDGTPIDIVLFERYGLQFGVPYACTMLFIFFGIFNLITAIFVENVMESARAKRQMARQEERVRVAQRLRALV